MPPSFRCINAVHLYHSRSSALRWMPQEALPPDLTQYLKKVGSNEAVQKGVAQALGKKGERGLNHPSTATAPVLPIPGAHCSSRVLRRAGANVRCWRRWTKQTALAFHAPRSMAKCRRRTVRRMATAANVLQPMLARLQDVHGCILLLASKGRLL